MIFPPAPKAIAKHGIVSLTDNLQPGECISISRAFINVFRPELEARLIHGGKQPCVTSNGSSPFHSGK